MGGLRRPHAPQKFLEAAQIRAGNLQPAVPKRFGHAGTGKMNPKWVCSLSGAPLHGCA